MADRKVYKTTTAEYLDDLFDDSSPEQLGAAYRSAQELLATTAGEPLSQAAAVLVERGELEPESVEQSKRGWRASKSVDRVIRHAYEEAIRLASAKEPPQSIETLWVTGATDDFEIHICEGTRHLTVLLFIPEAFAYGSRRARARSWVVRAAGEPDLAGARVLDEEDPRVVLTQVSGPR